MFNSKNDGHEKVQLVDERDKPIGVLDKLKAHQNGARLHRAISVFIFNRKGEMLLQQRSDDKYHSPGKWSNTVCSHPYAGERTETAAHRRLREEMGFDCNLNEEFEFTYKTPVGNGLTEWEFDHMFFGRFSGTPKPNPSEVKNYKWVAPRRLKQEMKANPRKYSAWFRLMLDKVMAHYNESGWHS